VNKDCGELEGILFLEAFWDYLSFLFEKRNFQGEQ
jgi:hypothetical protein